MAARTFACVSRASTLPARTSLGLSTPLTARSSWPEHALRTARPLLLVAFYSCLPVLPSSLCYALLPLCSPSPPPPPLSPSLSPLWA